jgi:hypothetical protein
MTCSQSKHNRAKYKSVKNRLINGVYSKISATLRIIAYGYKGSVSLSTLYVYYNCNRFFVILGRGDVAILLCCYIKLRNRYAEFTDVSNMAETKTIAIFGPLSKYNKKINNLFKICIIF